MGDTSFRLKLEMENISPHTQSNFQTTGEIQNIPVVKSRIREISFFQLWNVLIRNIHDWQEISRRLSMKKKIICTFHIQKVRTSTDRISTSILFSWWQEKQLQQKSKWFLFPPRNVQKFLTSQKCNINVFLQTLDLLARLIKTTYGS